MTRWPMPKAKSTRARLSAFSIPSRTKSATTRRCSVSSDLVRRDAAPAWRRRHEERARGSRRATVESFTGQGRAARARRAVRAGDGVRSRGADSDRTRARRAHRAFPRRRSRPRAAPAARAQHLERARAAFAARDSDDNRRTAMRESAAAIALDPSLDGAAELVGRLMLEPPKRDAARSSRRDGMPTTCATRRSSHAPACGP